MSRYPERTVVIWPTRLNSILLLYLNFIHFYRHSLQQFRAAQSSQFLFWDNYGASDSLNQYDLFCRDGARSIALAAAAKPLLRNIHEVVNIV